jgi:hypothetical protein
VLAAFFFGCLALVRLETIWVFLRSPWQSMILLAAYSLGVITLTGTAKIYGLTIHVDLQAWRDIAIITILLLIFVLIRNNLLRMIGLANGNGAPGLEFLLYQATLPGIAEELAYRGVIQTRLNKIFGRPWSLFKAPLGWGYIITAIIFWAVHAFRVEGLSLYFFWQTLTLQMVVGLALGWLRERSGSLVPGILAHNLVNLVWTLT